MTAGPELSIVVPVLNEADALDSFWAMLARQTGVEFEVLFVDGGSEDGTLERLRALAAANPVRVRVCCGERGRGRQLNLGAAQALAPWLLFLHVDCRLSRSDQLALALAQLLQTTATAGHDRIAGHFPLRFAEPKTRSPLGYAYYEAKTRLDRPGCTHGDQGFLLSRAFFWQVGPFEDTLPVLEDTRLAERVRTQGRWLLLSGEIETSARRFEAEGLWQRQVLNALIMNFSALEWTEFFAHLPGLYRSQSRTGSLQLTPFFARLREMMSQLPRRQLWSLWYRTGDYVRSQGWQLAFALDVRHNFRRRLPVGSGATPWLDRWDRLFEPLTDHCLGRCAAALLTWCWFQSTRYWCLWTEGEEHRSNPQPNDQEQQ